MVQVKNGRFLLLMSEHHFVRGLAKMKLKAGTALVVMLAMAVGRIKKNQKEKMRSLAAAA